MANIFAEPIFLDVAFKGTYLGTIGTYLGTIGTYLVILQFT